MNESSGPNPLAIGVLRETYAGEKRVALIPADVQRLSPLATIHVENGAGVAAGFSDADYISAGSSQNP
jgi:NAD(P) transhydrogenase subunit alpha